MQSCSTTFINTALPTSAFSGAAVFPHWNDLYFFANTTQGIYYAYQGVAPSRTLTFEYYASYYLQSAEYCHFEVLFFENMPGVVQFIYYESTDGGATASIGVQGSRVIVLILILLLKIVLMI